MVNLSIGRGRKIAHASLHNHHIYNKVNDGEGN